MVSSYFGQLLAHCFPASHRHRPDFFSLCRLLAYHTETAGGMQSCVLEQNHISLVVRQFERFIAAAELLPGSSCAEADFDLQCLAAVFRGIVSPGGAPASEVQGLRQSSSSTVFDLNIQKLCGFRKSAIKLLWGIKQLPTVSFVEILQFDLHGNLSRVASLPASASFTDSRTSFNNHSTALCVACQTLQYLVRREQSANLGVAEFQQTAGLQLKARHRVTFSTVSLTSWYPSHTMDSSYKVLAVA